MTRKCLETTPGRLSLEAFLRRHATDSLTLEIGAEDSTYKKWFPNRAAINVTSNPHVNLVADVYRLPFPDEVFAILLCTEVLEHLNTPALALAEMRRVLRPGGKLLLTTPFAFPIHYAPTDYYRYTRFGLMHLLGNWEIDQLTETTTDGAAMATLFHHWLMKKKGLQWKLPKLVWWALWAMLTRSYQAGRNLSSANQRLPAGYLVVAYKPVGS